MGIKGKSTSFYRCYSAESTLKRPGELLHGMWEDLAGSRQLAWRLMVRDISAQYRQTYFGIMWAFVPPVILAVGLVLARQANVISLGTTELPYAAYVMLSVILWQTFTESLMAPIHALQQAKPMLAKIYFPREALILSKVGEVLFNFGIKLVLVILIYWWYGLSITWMVLFAPFALLNLIVLGFAIGVALAPVGGLFLDISKSLSALLGAWLFLTPVIYPMPEAGLFGEIVRLNPVTPLLVTTRELATSGVVTDYEAFAVVSGISWVGLFIAWIIYRASMPFVIERMSA